ncbi:MAG TPA: AAA family ATPase [Thermoanaerobaculia bacterium]|nr:AAA family ATPase [Thermoanaerobaculia bacterium]
MRLRRLRIASYKNVRGCDIEFPEEPWLHAVIGSNGSGKSNLIEAILEILVGCYFAKPPRFDFTLEFVAQSRVVVLHREQHRLTVTVDGAPMPIAQFSRRLRDGEAQVFYPETTLVYYSGECKRVEALIGRYRRHFQLLTRKPETDRYRPLFVFSSNRQAEVILLALFAHDGRELLDRLRLDSIVDVSISLRSPAGFDPTKHEPKLWNTAGAIRRIVAAIDATATSQGRPASMFIRDEAAELSDVSAELEESVASAPDSVEDRVYNFAHGALRELARRLAKGNDNVYQALESLRARGMLNSVSFKLKGLRGADVFSFDQLSEGEKQLLAVIGAVTLTNQNDNLVLLDEPDTHLNPYWSWDYPSMLSEALAKAKLPRATVFMATHDPVMISGMVKEQVLLADMSGEQPAFTRPHRHPRGQGVANLLCSPEFFGLPSSLDKETQKLLDERLEISVKPELSEADRRRLRKLNEMLEMIPAGVSERDPNYVEFLRRREGA